MHHFKRETLLRFTMQPTATLLMVISQLAYTQSTMLSLMVLLVLHGINGIIVLACRVCRLNICVLCCTVDSISSVRPPFDSRAHCFIAISLLACTQSAMLSLIRYCWFRMESMATSTGHAKYNA